MLEEMQSIDQQKCAFFNPRIVLNRIIYSKALNSIWSYDEHIYSATVWIKFPDWFKI